MLDSCCCLDRVVPDGMSQVWRRSEVENHKRRTPNTRLSSGTSEHTSSSSRNVPGRMIRSNFFGTGIKSKWNRPVWTRTFRINFSEGSGPPFNHQIVHGLPPAPFSHPDFLKCWCSRHKTALSVSAWGDQTWGISEGYSVVEHAPV